MKKGMNPKLPFSTIFVQFFMSFLCGPEFLLCLYGLCTCRTPDSSNFIQGDLHGRSKVEETLSRLIKLISPL
jgi:hypothetical protein